MSDTALGRTDAARLDRLHDLLARAVSRCPRHVAIAVLGQAAVARVVGESPGRTIDVEVPGDVDPVLAPDGPLRPVPHVVEVTGQMTGPSGETWNIASVWARDPDGTVRLITATPTRRGP